MAPDATNALTRELRRYIKKKNNELVFLCVGTPLLCGDSLGPYVGSSLINLGIDNVYGSLDAPVHAENIELYRNVIQKSYSRPTIVAIDAALGTNAQTGFITVRRGPLQPGQAVGKDIAPIGHIEVTGIFDSISEKHTQSLTFFMSKIITQGILKNIKKC